MYRTYKIVTRAIPVLLVMVLGSMFPNTRIQNRAVEGILEKTSNSANTDLIGKRTKLISQISKKWYSEEKIFI
jgi:membrane protein implicated in regulation of membrane protease activity